MGDSMFDIFGDHITRQAVRNVSRQALNNVENMGKTVSTGPIKPNEPGKPLDVKMKKSFLSNTGKTLQSTPVRQALAPRAVDVGTLIFNEAEEKVDKNIEDEPSNSFDKFSYDSDDAFSNNMMNTIMEALEFTKAKDFCDYYQDAMQYPLDDTPPSTPPPAPMKHDLEWETTRHDLDLLKDDFDYDCEPFYFSEDEFPDLSFTRIN